MNFEDLSKKADEQLANMQKEAKLFTKADVMEAFGKATVEMVKEARETVSVDTYEDIKEMMEFELQISVITAHAAHIVIDSLFDEGEVKDE